jgi:hypothetical protein
MRRSLMVSLAAVALVAVTWAPTAFAQDPADATVLFANRIDAYLALRTDARTGLAPHEIIDPRIRAISGALLAARLRELRSGAAEGDLFTVPMSASIRARLRRCFDPTEVDALLAQRYGEGLPAANAVRINFGCARDVAVSPPVSVLSALPPLPGVLGYRLVGRDIVLWDEEADIALDVVRNALPEPGVGDFVGIRLPVNCLCGGSHGDCQSDR